MSVRKPIFDFTENGIVQVTNFKKVHPDAVTPTYGTPLSAGFDLTTVEEVTVSPWEPQLVSTGLVIQAPPSHMLYITFRSSTPRKYDVTVLEGIVDEDYCGDDDVLRLQVIALPTDPLLGDIKTVTVPAGSRIAQGIFIPVSHASFHEVTEESIAENRGGWGSTG